MIRTIAILWYLLGVAGALPAMFSVMMVDAPGASERLATLTLMYATLAFPLVCFGSATAALKLRRDERTRAKRMLCLPLVVVLVGAAAVLWITVKQGGQFNG